MLRRRSGLGLLLLLALLATFGSATFGSPDSAFTPSYFDGQDGDGALWAVLEGMPAVLIAVSPPRSSPCARTRSPRLAPPAFARRLSPSSLSPAARIIT